MTVGSIELVFVGSVGSALTILPRCERGFVLALKTYAIPRKQDIELIIPIVYRQGVWLTIKVLLNSKHSAYKANVASNPKLEVFI